jgi:6-phosphogluconolactonase
MKKNSFLLLVFLILTNSISQAQKKAATPSKNVRYDVFVGTYTQKESHVDGKGEGIYRLQFDEALNVISQTVIKEVTNPSFITLSEDKKNLYAVEETMPTGSVCSYGIDNQEVKFLNRQSSEGGAACQLAVNKDKSYLAVANYAGANVAVFPIEPNGSLRKNVGIVNIEGKGTTSRQEAAHPHQVTFLPNEKLHFLVADLGTDKVHDCTLNVTKEGMSQSVNTYYSSVNGAGPRHLVFKNKHFTYLLNELNSTIDVLQDKKNIQTITTLPKGYKEFNFGADIHITPNGKYLYASNRGHNSIAIYRILVDGKLQNVDYQSTNGKFPRNFNLTPDGKYLFCANQNSDNIVIFRILSSGKLAETKQIEVKTPVCIQFK